MTFTKKKAQSLIAFNGFNQVIKTENVNDRVIFLDEKLQQLNIQDFRINSNDDDSQNRIETFKNLLRHLTEQKMVFPKEKQKKINKKTEKSRQKKEEKKKSVQQKSITQNDTDKAKPKSKSKQKHSIDKRVTRSQSKADTKELSQNASKSKPKRY